MTILIAIASIAGCRTDSAPMPPPLPPASTRMPSTPPPVPPPRDAASVTVHGRVVDTFGSPVAHAAVLVKAADSLCRHIGPEVGALTDEAGNYSMTIEMSGPDAVQGCVVVEGNSGAAQGSAASSALFAPPDAPRQIVNVDVRLAPAMVLTAAEAERLAQLLVTSINDPASSAGTELALHLRGGIEAVRVAVEQYRAILGNVTRLHSSGYEEFPLTGRGPSRRYSFEMEGSRGRRSRLDVYQETLVRLHSIPVDYGQRAERFVMHYVRTIASGDAEDLARLLNPDDIDFPVARAREMIVAHRLRYDTATLRPEFVDLDELRGRMTWRIVGKSRSGDEESEILELQFGDGLIGVVGL